MLERAPAVQLPATTYLVEDDKRPETYESLESRVSVCGRGEGEEGGVAIKVHHRPYSTSYERRGGRKCVK